MSCVAAVVEDGKVWVGADSAASDGEDMVTLTNRKAFFNGPYLIGAVGSMRMTQLLQYKLEPPSYVDPKVPLIKFMATDFIEAVRRTFSVGGFMAQQDEHSSSGIFLVAFRGHIFRFEGNFQVFERVDGFEAIGCGSPYALGALSVTPLDTAKLRLEKALGAATYFSAHVRKPYLILNEGNKHEAA